MKAITLLLFVFVLVTGGAVGVSLFGSHIQAATTAPIYQPLLATSKPLAPTPLPRDVITRRAKPDISALQSSGILITAIYTVSIDVEKERAAKWLWFDGEMVRVHAESTVLAGVDMATTRYDDSKRTITLPASRLYWIVPNVNTSGVAEQVFSPLQTTGEMDGALVNAATIEAHSRIRQAACEKGITETAANVAGIQVARLVRLAGFDDIRVIAQAGECK